MQNAKSIETIDSWNEKNETKISSELSQHTEEEKYKEKSLIEGTAGVAVSMDKSLDPFRVF